MLVEDSRTVRITTKMILSLHGGYEVFDYSNAEEAVNDLYNEIDIDFIISDLKLPGMSGFQLVEKMKKIEKYHNIPVLIITGESRALELQELSHGNIIDGWLTKPFDGKVLVTLVKTYLEN